MFVGNAPYTPLEYHALQESEDWPRWEKAIEEDSLGQPPMFNAYTSGNLIHQAYHLLQWERHTGRKVNTLDSIVEIGAGYGALPKIIRRLGFAGRYLIFDLPEVRLLQEYYLGALKVAAEWGDLGKTDHLTPDLLIGLWSLSEMSTAMQAEYLSRLSPIHYLLAALDAPWEGKDNGATLRKLAEYLTRREIAHLRGNYYLLG